MAHYMILIIYTVYIIIVEAQHPPPRGKCNTAGWYSAGEMNLLLCCALLFFFLEKMVMRILYHRVAARLGNYIMCPHMYTKQKVGKKIDLPNTDKNA